MSKELEAFRDILGILRAVSGCEVDMESERVKIVKSALQRLETIDNSKPSEALEILYNNAKIDRDRIEKGGVVTYAEEIEHNEGIKPYYDTIKQALQKAQEQEKVLEIIREKNVDIRWIKITDTVKKYNDGRDEDLNYELTQIEFDLLKEVIK